jgi:signal peptidase I
LGSTEASAPRAAPWLLRHLRRRNRLNSPCTWDSLVGRRAVALSGIAIALSAALGSWVQVPILETYRVNGSSMEPTLHCGGSPGCQRMRPETILASGVPFVLTAPRRGDIVVIRRDAPTCGGQAALVKRIIGLPGDVISQDNGTVQVDGAALTEEYVPARQRGVGSLRPRRLGDDQYFVMGDNRIVSCDSRSFGPIQRSEIRGKVVSVLNDRIGRSW